MRGDWAETHFMLLAPRHNSNVQQGADFYRKFLATPGTERAAFVNVELEQFVEALGWAGERQTSPSAPPAASDATDEAAILQVPIVARYVAHDDRCRGGSATRPETGRSKFLRGSCTISSDAGSCFYHSVAMYFTSMNSCRPWCDPSRPRPLCFTPPKGAAGSETSPRFSAIMPASSASDTRRPRLKSPV